MAAKVPSSLEENEKVSLFYSCALSTFHGGEKLCSLFILAGKYLKREEYKWANTIIVGPKVPR